MIQSKQTIEEHRAQYRALANELHNLQQMCGDEKTKYRQAYLIGRLMVEAEMAKVLYGLDFSVS